MQLVACKLPIELYSVPWMSGMPSSAWADVLKHIYSENEIFGKSIIMEFGIRDPGIDLSGFPMIISNSVICD